jgi:hypothetical protein
MRSRGTASEQPPRRWTAVVSTGRRQRYKVLLNGSGGVRLRRLESGATTPEPFGFFTTRFVEAASPADAAAEALRMVTAEAAEYSLPEHPCTIQVQQVEEDRSATAGSGKGFTFYREETH